MKKSISNPHEKTGIAKNFMNKIGKIYHFFVNFAITVPIIHAV